MRTRTRQRLITAMVVALGCGGCQPPDDCGSPIQGETGITSLATDGFFLFWTEVNGSVKKADVGGCAPATTLVPPSDPVVVVDHIAMNGGHVFWTSGEGPSTTLEKMSRKGGEPEAVIVEDGIVAVVADEAHLCWMTGQGVAKCKEIEGSDSLPPDVVSPAGPMAIHGGTLFFASKGGMRKAAIPMTDDPIEGEPVQLDPPSGNVLSLALTSQHLCWTEVGAKGDFSVRAAAPSGGPSRVVASRGSKPGNVACDSNDVFWIDGENAVFQASIDGEGSAMSVVEGLPGRASFVMDAEGIYVASSAKATVGLHGKRGSASGAM